MANFLQTVTFFFILLLMTFMVSISVSIASGIEEEEVQLPEPQGACSSDPCSPATPCPSKDEMCYTSNGVFYCCVEPPFPGAEAVGN